MTELEKVKRYLETQKWSRERRYRARAIVLMLREKFNNIGESNFPIDKLEDFCKDYTSYDRYFRLVQRENEVLRGEDWGDGEGLAQQSQVNLGYSAGFHKDIKTLELIK